MKNFGWVTSLGITLTYISHRLNKFVEKMKTDFKSKGKTAGKTAVVPVSTSINPNKMLIQHMGFIG